MKLRCLTAIALLPGLAGCGSSPSGPSRSCRRYPVRYTDNGVAGTCELSGPRLHCHASLSNSTWEYASLADFIAEGAVPNLVLARQRTWSGGGPMLISYSSHTTVTTYEGPRALTRVRKASNAFASWTIDSVMYERWDRFGRPTAGHITRGETTEPLTLRYDDAARRVEVSNGEYRVEDGNGNTVEESEFGGSPHVFAFQEMGEVCE